MSDWTPPDSTAPAPSPAPLPNPTRATTPNQIPGAMPPAPSYATAPRPVAITATVPPQPQPSTSGPTPSYLAPPAGGAAPYTPASHYVPNAPLPPTGPKTSGWCTSALVAGLASWVIPIIGGLIAIGLAVTGYFAVGNSKGTRTGKGLAISGGVIGLLSVLLWGSAFLNEDFRAGFSEGLNEGYAQTQPSRLLEPGECLSISLNDTTNFQVDRSNVVECSTPHDAEYAGSVFHPAPAGASYPGEEPVFEHLIDLCLERFETHVGTSYENSPDLDLFISYPQGFTWDTFNDREAACFIVTVDGSMLNGPVGLRS